MNVERIGFNFDQWPLKIGERAFVCIDILVKDANEGYKEKQRGFEVFLFHFICVTKN